MSSADPKGLSRDEYAAIAAFRFELRRFLAFSEQAAASHGLPAQQHQGLLAIAGHKETQPPTSGSIAQQLLIAQPTAAELVSRMVEAGLVSKQPSASDRRRTELTLTAKAEHLLHALTEAHVAELEVLEPALTRALSRMGRLSRR
jgi:DNA-binding MarR family transcriptional regulator